MLPGDFYRKLKKLNSRLRIYCADDNSRPAGLWMWKDGELFEICAVDKNDLREWPTYNQYGKMIKGGWNRVLAILVQAKLIDLHQSQKLFGYWNEHREPVQYFDKKPIDRAIEQLQAVKYRTIENPLNEGQMIEVPVYNKDDVYDIGKMVAKENKRSGPPASMQTDHNLGE